MGTAHLPRGVPEFLDLSSTKNGRKKLGSEGVLSSAPPSRKCPHPKIAEFSKSDPLFRMNPTLVAPIHSKVGTSYIVGHGASPYRCPRVSRSVSQRTGRKKIGIRGGLVPGTTQQNLTRPQKGLILKVGPFISSEPDPSGSVSLEIPRRLHSWARRISLEGSPNF